MSAKYRLLVPAVVLTAALSLSACSSGDDSAPEAAASGGTLAGQLTTDPSTFDPATAIGGDDYIVDRLLYDSVLRRDADDGIVGGLASEWEAVSAAEYNFTIRDDATCSDGTPITASIVADSLTYFANPETKSNFRTLVFGSGTATITGDDDTSTVSIALSEPYANLERGLTLAQSGIICPAGLEDLAGLKTGTVDGAFSGPYVLDEAQAGISYTLALREDYEAWPYFAEDLPGAPADTLELTLVTDASTTANQLLSGDLDYANVLGDTIDRFDGNDDYTATPTIWAGVYLLFNEAETSVFYDNQPLRQAVAQAFEREAYNTVFSDDRSELFTSVVSSQYTCVNTDESLLESYDPDAAGEILDGTEIDFVQSTAFGDAGAGGEFIQAALDSLGSTVNLTSTDNATWATTINTPGAEWDMTLMGDINAVQVISASLSRVMGPSVAEGGRNFGSIVNPEGYEALKEGLASSDVDEQCAAFDIAQQTMLERDDVVPLAGVVTNLIARDGVTIRAFGDYIDIATLRVSN